MMFPNILIIDDQLSINHDQRDSFCFDCDLMDVERLPNGSGVDNHNESRKLAAAFFCSGEGEEGYSYELIEQVVERGPGNSGSRDWSLVLLDVGFGDDDRFGLGVEKRLSARFPGLPIVMLTGVSQADLDDSSIPYLSKIDIKSHHLKVKLLKHGCLTREHTEDLLQLKRRNIIAKSQSMRNVLLQAFIFAELDISTLILGETGVGKEVIARYIHDLSPRGAAPFVARNIAEISKEQMSAELFGIEPRAATDVSERTGIFAQAEKGTLLLDEIGDMPMDAQQAVLRALQERKIVRMGGRKEIPIDIRLLTATSRDMERLMAEGLFRRDVYFRIAQGIIEIPALRDRSEDICPLARHFLDGFQKRTNRTGISLSKDAVEVLEEQTFPGNVRELRNLIERVAIHKGNNEVINSKDLLREIKKDDGRRSEAPPRKPAPSSSPDGMDFASLEALLESVQVPKSASELKGKLSSLNDAYGRLIGRLLETALQELRHTHGNDNILPALKLLLSKEEVKSTSHAYDVLLSLLKAFQSSILAPSSDGAAKTELEIALMKARKIRRPKMEQGQR